MGTGPGWWVSWVDICPWQGRIIPLGQATASCHPPPPPLLPYFKPVLARHTDKASSTLTSLFSLSSASVSPASINYKLSLWTRPFYSVPASSLVHHCFMSSSSSFSTFLVKPEQNRRRGREAERQRGITDIASEQRRCEWGLTERRKQGRGIQRGGAGETEGGGSQGLSNHNEA